MRWPIHASVVRGPALEGETALYLFSDRLCRIQQTRIQPGLRGAGSLILHDQNRVEMIHAACLRGQFTTNFYGARILSNGNSGMHRLGECFALGATRTRHSVELYYDSAKVLRRVQARSLALIPGAPRLIAVSGGMVPGIWRVIRVVRHLPGKSRGSVTIAPKFPQPRRFLP